MTRTSHNRGRMAAPRLGPFLVMTPSSVDRAFWKSGAYRRMSASADLWSLWQTCTFNLMSIRFFRRDENSAAVESSYAMESWFIFWIAFAVLQALWRFCAPEHYWRWRFWVLLFNRANRLYIFLHSVHVSTNFERTKIITMLHSRPPSGAPPPGPPVRLLATFRTAILVSHAALPLIHAANTPLPFLPQLAFHSIYLASLVSVALPTTLTLISAPPPPHPPPPHPPPPPPHPTPAAALLADIHHLCQTATAAMHTLHTSLCSVPYDPSFLRSACHPHGPTTVLLFACLLLGFLLPVYISYRLEAHTKTLFLTHLLNAAAAATAAPPHPAPSDPTTTSGISSSIRSPSLHRRHHPPPHPNHEPSTPPEHPPSPTLAAAAQLHGAASAVQLKASSAVALAASCSLPHWTDVVNIMLMVFLAWAAAMHLSTHVHLLYLA